MLEPAPALQLRLKHRLADRQLTHTSVIGASAASIPLRDHSVDIAHARFAYFFGSSCEPGIAELARILKPGGRAFIIDNYLRSGTFGSWIRTAYDFPEERIERHEAFWRDQGFTTEQIASRWSFQNREDFERVIHLEFPVEHATALLRNHPGLDIDYNLLLIHRTLG